VTFFSFIKHLLLLLDDRLPYFGGNNPPLQLGPHVHLGARERNALGQYESPPPPALDRRPVENSEDGSSVKHMLVAAVQGQCKCLNIRYHSGGGSIIC
jgi:hypothetical protein